jgi:hypothetical protein
MDSGLTSQEANALINDDPLLHDCDLTDKGVEQAKVISFVL